MTTVPGSALLSVLTAPVRALFVSEAKQGILLIAVAALALVAANSALAPSYYGWFHGTLAWTPIAKLSNALLWINDGLMAIFFLLIGLEIERELYIGELSDPKNALLPVAAAIGGMVIPALLHFLFNHGAATVDGAGIPMATDIAFALGILALLGDRIPISLKVFLTALAIIDDLGAIVVIAIFYVSDFSGLYFGLAIAIFSLLLVLNRLNMKRLSVYLGLGVIMWYFMLRSGVHATIAGVLLAFAIPFRNLDGNSPSYRLQHFLHKPVAFVIMPLFALANTGIYLRGDWLEGLVSANGLGIVAGLLVGKPLGIVLFSLLTVRFGWSRLPSEVCWRQMVGVAFLGGIGFTMSIFITLLAFRNPEIIASSKLSILVASILAGTIGYLILRKQSADST